MTTDAELLRAYVNKRSEAAFARLVERHLPLVYSAALRQLNGDAHLAQDVAQTVFLTLVRKAAALTDYASLAGWLYISTNFAVSQVVRSNRRRETREQEAQAMHELLGSTPGANDWEQVRPVLDDAMHELPAADREVVLLRFFQQRPFAEIGAALNVSEDAARMRVDRALDKLRALLGRREITSTGAALATALANQAIVATPSGLAVAITGVALAGAPVATSTVTATGFFMSTSTKIVSAIAVAAIGLAVYQVNRVGQVEQALTVTTREREAARAQIRELNQQAAVVNQRTAETQQELTTLRRDLDTARSAKAPPASPATGAAIGSAGTFTFQPAAPGTDPAEGRRRAREMNIEGMEISYRAFTRQIGFTPAQQEQFKALMVDYMDRRDGQIRTAMTAALAQNPRPDRATMQDIHEATANQAYEDWLVTMRATFGDSVVQSFQRYRDTMAGREVTKELSSALFYSDAPLTVAQADQLVEIIASNSRNAQGKVDLSAMNTDAILTQAHAILSVSQLAALRRVQQEVQLKASANTTAKTPSK